MTEAEHLSKEKIMKKRTGQHHPLRRKVGKVRELASGYAGWGNACSGKTQERNKK